MNEKLYQALKSYTPSKEDAKDFSRTVKEREDSFRASSKSHAPSNSDRMRCFNL
jgi:hypothetical protein